MLPAQTRDWSKHWRLEPGIVFLNHGSFGACPAAVLEEQQKLRDRMEAEPVRFFVREYEELLAEARLELGRFVGASGDDLAFVPNATAGVNAVLRSLKLTSEDELLTTDHEYRACKNALDHVASRSGAAVVVAKIPFPIGSSDEVVGAVLAHVTRRTRIALIDHVTSSTGLVLPIQRIVAELAGRGIDTLVDGAHGPGMVELRLDELGAAYYAANCHKWLCAPKGSAFLHVRRERQAGLHPLAISHGYHWQNPELSLFRFEFDWTGTADPSPYLSVPAAIRLMGSLVEGGWPELMRVNREGTLAARRLLCGRLDVKPPCPDEMIGSLAALPIADGSSEPPRSVNSTDPLQDELFFRHRIEVPVFPFPRPPNRLVRISHQLYNRPEDYEKLAGALLELGAAR